MLITIVFLVAAIGICILNFGENRSFSTTEAAAHQISIDKAIYEAGLLSQQQAEYRLAFAAKYGMNEAEYRAAQQQEEARRRAEAADPQHLGRDALLSGSVIISREQQQDTSIPIGTVSPSGTGMVWSGTGWTNPDNVPKPPDVKVQENADANSIIYVGPSDTASVGARDAAGNLTGEYKPNVLFENAAGKAEGMVVPLTGYALAAYDKADERSRRLSTGEYAKVSPPLIVASPLLMDKMGSAYKMAVEADRSGQILDPTVYATAYKQGYRGDAILPIKDGQIDFTAGMQIIPPYNATPGGKMVTDASGRTTYVPDIGSTNPTLVGGRNNFVPIGSFVTQLREDSKIRYNEVGAYDLSQVVKSTTPGFIRLYPMITAGGGPGSLQSGMVGGKAQTPIVVDEYGMNPLYDPKDPLVMDILKNPQNYSRQGSELYGRVTLLTGKTLKGEFLKGNTIMPGRFKRDSENYSNLVDFSSVNIPKQKTSNMELPLYASPTFATDAEFQKVNPTSGKMEAVYPDFSPVKTTVISETQPEYILVRPEPIERVYRQAPEPYSSESTKYTHQYGGYVNTPGFDVEKELKENAMYNINADEMFADRARAARFQTQTWLEPQGYQLVKNPKAGELVNNAQPVGAVSAQPTPFVSIDTTKGQTKGEISTETKPSEQWWQGIPLVGGFIPGGILPETSRMGAGAGLATLIAPTVTTTTRQTGTEIVERASLKNAGADFAPTFIGADNKPTQQMSFPVGEPYKKGGIEYQDYQTYDLSKVALAKTESTAIAGPSPATQWFDQLNVKASEAMGFDKIQPLTTEQIKTVSPLMATLPGGAFFAANLANPITADYTASYLKGEAAGVTQRPVEAGMWAGLGFAMGGATRIGTEAIGASKAAFATAEQPILFGKYLQPQTALKYTTGVEKSLPYLFGGMYGADIAARSTKMGTDLSPASAERFGALMSTEVRPMIAGGAVGYFAPEIGRGVGAGVKGGIKGAGEFAYSLKQRAYGIERIPKGSEYYIEPVVSEPIGIGYAKQKGMDSESGVFSFGGSKRALPGETVYPRETPTIETVRGTYSPSLEEAKAIIKARYPNQPVETYLVGRETPKLDIIGSTGKETTYKVVEPIGGGIITEGTTVTTGEGKPLKFASLYYETVVRPQFVGKYERTYGVPLKETQIYKEATPSERRKMVFEERESIRLAEKAYRPRTTGGIGGYKFDYSGTQGLKPKGDYEFAVSSGIAAGDQMLQLKSLATSEHLSPFRKKQFALMEEEAYLSSQQSIRAPGELTTQYQSTAMSTVQQPGTMADVFGRKYLSQQEQIRNAIYEANRMRLGTLSESTQTSKQIQSEMQLQRQITTPISEMAVLKEKGVVSLIGLDTKRNQEIQQTLNRDILSLQGIKPKQQQRTSQEIGSVPIQRQPQPTQQKQIPRQIPPPPVPIPTPRIPTLPVSVGAGGGMRQGKRTFTETFRVGSGIGWIDIAGKPAQQPRQPARQPQVMPQQKRSVGKSQSVGMNIPTEQKKPSTKRK